MKKLLLASVGVVAMATAATAADLPARMPAKAPAYVAPLYNWTGFYIGGHLGWARVDLDSTLVGAFAPFGAGASFGGSDDGFIYGGQVGFNWQTGAWVFGVEGQLSGTDIGSSGSVTSIPTLAFPLAVTGTTSSNIDWMATLAARIGYAFGPTGNVLLYAKGGIAWLDWSVCGSTTVASIVTSGGCGGGTETGWMLGLGLEYGFTPNWSAKIEYNYLDFGKKDATLSGTSCFFSTGDVGGQGCFTDTATGPVDTQIHMVKFGLNYRFTGGWMP